MKAVHESCILTFMAFINYYKSLDPLVAVSYWGNSNVLILTLTARVLKTAEKEICIVFYSQHACASILI